MRDYFEHNFKTYIVYGIVFELMLQCYNPYAIKFLQRIGGSEFDVSLLNSLKGLFMIFVVLPSAIFLNRIYNKKRITAILALSIGALSFILTFIPLMERSLRVTMFLFISALITIPLAVYNVVYQSVTGELFPERRAQVLAKRSQYTIVFMTSFTLLSGLVFKWFADTPNDYIHIYQVLFTLSFILGIASFVIFNHIKYRHSCNHTTIHFVEQFKHIKSNTSFIRFITASTIFHFGWQMGWPLFSIYMINTLGADELWLAIINIGSALAMMLGHTQWPNIIDRLGHSRVSAICTLGMALTPILYAISPNLITLAIISTVSGIFTSGTITVLFADMLDVTPADGRMIYVGVYHTLINFTLAISPMVGHFFLSRYSIYIALFVTSAFRLIGSTAFFIRDRVERRAT